MVRSYTQRKVQSVVRCTHDAWFVEVQEVRSYAVSEWLGVGIVLVDISPFFHSFCFFFFFFFFFLFSPFLLLPLIFSLHLPGNNKPVDLRG